MISMFWEALFEYADRVRKEGKNEKLETVREIEDMLHKAYLDSKAFKVPKKTINELGRKPKNKLEAFVFSIRGVTAQDIGNETVYWFEGLTYSSAEQLIKDLVKKIYSLDKSTKHFSSQNTVLTKELEKEREKLKKLTKGLEDTERQIRTIRKHIKDWEDQKIKDYMEKLSLKNDMLQEIIYSVDNVKHVK